MSLSGNATYQDKSQAEVASGPSAGTCSNLSQSARFAAVGDWATSGSRAVGPEGRGKHFGLRVEGVNFLRVKMGWYSASAVY